MKKKYQKIAIPVVLALLTQVASPLSLVAAEQVTASVEQKADVVKEAQKTISLKEAINIVRSNFQVPEELKEFTSGLNNYNNKETWSLNWGANSGLEGNVIAQVDVNTGEIVSVYSWRNNESANQEAKVPAYSYQDAQNIAKGIVEKLLKDRLEEIKFIEGDEQIVPLNDYGSPSYTLQWERVVNGIAYPNNGVTVQVNSRTGEIAGYNLNWDRVDFPTNENAIDKEKAREVFQENELLELQYSLPSEVRPLSLKEDKSPEAQLIYQINNKSYNGIIDAITGKPFTLKPGQWLPVDHVGQMGNGGGMEKSTGNDSLTPAELEEIEDSSQFMSKEEAIEALKKYIEIPTGLTLVNSSLNLDGPFQKTRVWNFDWSSNDENYRSLSARVDAKTGEVLNFYLYSPTDPEGTKNRVDRMTAQKVADKFLKGIQPRRIAEVKIIDTQSSGMTYPENLITQDFQYQRIVNGVPFTENGFTISIDTVTQKVIGFQMNWWDVAFPAQSKAMDQSKAYDNFFTGRPLDLVYARIQNNGIPGEVRLIYQPSSKNSVTNSNKFNAITGEFLDWSGTPLKENPSSYVFQDISGNFAEKEITLLGQAGAFGEFDSNFKPNENVTLGSTLRAMLIAKNGAWGNHNLSDQEAMEQAKKLGWLKEDLKSDQGVTRELQAKLLVRMLGYEKIAKIEGIYTLAYKDASTISKENIGYVALAKGLGFIKTSGDKFEPNQKVSRAEAAYSIVNSLNAAQAR